MGLFDVLFKNRPKEPTKPTSTFQMLNGYKPYFSSYSGSIYESQLIRSVINARAVAISKLNVVVEGSANPWLQTRLKNAPNQFMSWSQFMYRLSTILDVQNTAFITPVFDDYGQVSGVYPILPSRCEIVQYGKTLYLRYEFSNGERASIELDSCGIMTKFQYQDDFYGESNDALLPTMDLIHIENQGIQEGVKSAATYRFYAQVNNFLDEEDLANERKRFSETNFSSEANAGGLLLFPNTYQNINQVKSEPWIVKAEELKIIQDNVFQYFGVNEDVLTNKAYGDAWTAFYEGAIEPFAIQFSEVMSTMLFTSNERSRGNKVMATSNRLQYMSNADKLNVSSQMLDRGIMSINDVREIWNMPPVEGGDVRIIRGEYYNADDKVNEENNDDE